MPAPLLIKPKSLLARCAGFLRVLPFLIILPLGLICVNLVQLVALCIKPLSRRTFVALNQGICGAWADTTVLSARWMYGTRIVLTGTNLPRDENAIIIVNHQQMVDITYLTHLSMSRRRTGDLKFFSKDPIKYVPGLGWALAMLGFPFVKRNWTRDRLSIARVFKRVTKDEIPVWLVTFPEGTRITPAKLTAAHEFAEARGLRKPVHTLVARSKGFVASVQGLRDHVTAVYDITIGYPEGVASLWQYIVGYTRVAHLHIERFALRDLPEDDDGLRQWLADRFAEKDRLLEGFYRDGAFPSAG